MSNAFSPGVEGKEGGEEEEEGGGESHQVVCIFPGLPTIPHQPVSEVLPLEQ